MERTNIGCSGPARKPVSLCACPPKGGGLVAANGNLLMAPGQLQTHSNYFDVGECPVVLTVFGLAANDVLCVEQIEMANGCPGWRNQCLITAPGDPSVAFAQPLLMGCEPVCMGACQTSLVIDMPGRYRLAMGTVGAGNGAGDPESLGNVLLTKREACGLTVTDAMRGANSGPSSFEQMVSMLDGLSPEQRCLLANLIAMGNAPAPSPCSC